MQEAVESVLRKRGRSLEGVIRAFGPYAAALGAIISAWLTSGENDTIMDTQGLSVPTRSRKDRGTGSGYAKDCIGSPFHTGDDRASLPRAIVMPFDGTMIWEHCGGDWGSILAARPDDNTTTEIQGSAHGAQGQET